MVVGVNRSNYGNCFTMFRGWMGFKIFILKYKYFDICENIYIFLNFDLMVLFGKGEK